MQNRSPSQRLTNGFVTKAAALAALTLTLLFTPPSLAASDEPIKFGEERFKLSAGGFFPGFSSEMTIDVMADGENKTIDVEEDLGLKSSTNTFRVDGYWRVGPRHRITVGYYALNRSGTRVLETDIEWEDVVYPVGVNIDSQVDFDVIPISYAYSFLKRENWEIAASIGVHWMKIDTSIEGQAFVDGDDVRARFIVIAGRSWLENAGRCRVAAACRICWQKSLC